METINFTRGVPANESFPIDEVIAAGADMAAVISAVCSAREPREAARKLTKRFR